MIIIQENSDPKLIRCSALALLSRREHSRYELSCKLQAHGFSTAVIDSILLDLQTENLLSDARFAEQYVHYRMEKGFGPLRIQMELTERGVSREIVAEYINTKDPIWNQQAERAFNKRFGTENKFAENYSERAKQMRFLNYRGFTSENIRHVFE